MDRALKKYLWDILDQSNFIEQVTATPLSFEQFEKTLVIVRAVERSFEIIGEALK